MTEHTNKNNTVGCVVVGVVNTDICAKPHKALIARDSNPGSVYTTIGGVGRNIAHNLTLLGIRVKLITVLGGDEQALRIRQSCSRLGIDISDSLTVDAASSCYVLITDENGVMQLAVNDMDIYEHMTPEFLETKLDVINSARICVADTNIPKASLEYLAQHCRVPLLTDPVSVPKSAKLKSIIGKLHTIKPNTAEAEALSGVRITDEASLAQTAKTLLETGLGRVFITRGSRGVYYADRQRSGALPCTSGNMVDSSGAGDSFMAAVCWACICGASLEDSARLGLAASAICLESGGAVSEYLSVKALLSRSGVTIQQLQGESNDRK